MLVDLFNLEEEGISSAISSQQRLNCYYDVTRDKEKARLSVIGMPGLDLYRQFGATPIRGLHVFGNYLYVVHKRAFWQVDNSGAKIQYGTLTTSEGFVSIANNGYGNQIMIADGTKGYIFNTSTNTFAAITDVDAVNSSTVDFDSGFFVVNQVGTARFYKSGSYDGTTWDPLDFATAEGESSNIVRIMTDQGEVVIFKQYSLEFWQNTGSPGFPYSRIGGANTEWGLASPWAVARIDNGLMFLGANRLGEVVVLKTSGYSVQRVSNPEVEFTFNSYSQVMNATAFGYLLGGHPMFQINFPSVPASWLYDGATGAWSQLQSNGIGRQRSELFVNYLNRKVVSDYSTGNLYLINPNSYTENGDILPFQITGRHIFNDYQNVSISKLQLDMEAGVGIATGQGSNPQVMLTVSKDNGHIFGNERWASMGAVGNYQTRVLWRRLGRARDFTFNFRITDPVKRIITGAAVEFTPGVPIAPS